MEEGGTEGNNRAVSLCDCLYFWERPRRPLGLSSWHCISRDCICWDEITEHLTFPARHSLGCATMGFVCVILSMCVFVCWFCHRCAMGHGRSNKNKERERQKKRATKRRKMKSLGGSVEAADNLSETSFWSGIHFKTAERQRWRTRDERKWRRGETREEANEWRRHNHGDGSGCCCHQSLKDRLKHCGGRRGEQRRIVPSFSGVRF